MSLSSALFSGISGLSVLGNAMTVIGDNIANVNTVGFKASRVTFQDVLSQSVATTAGTTQVGRGTSLADISSSFAQGSFESTDSATDLAIGGEGFFMVRDPNNEENEFYTRAGEFRFDKDGNFINPAGYIVRGWALNEDTGEDMGTITDVILQSFTSSPDETDKITAITNLDSDANSKAISLSNIWDGTASTPIAATSYEYQSTMKVYDSLGSTHDITIYYDMVSDTNWEYIVTSNPSEDARTGFAGTSSAGLLARGTIAFSQTAGTITTMTMDRLGGITGGHMQSYGTPTVTNTGLGTVTDSDVTVAYNNQIALTEDGTVTMEFDQVPDTDQTWTNGGGGTFDEIIVNNDAELTAATGGTKMEVELIGGVWTKTAHASYPAFTVTNQAVAADGFTIDLDGVGGADITVNTTTAANGDKLEFHIKPLNWTCNAVPAAYTGLDAADEITGTFTGYALNLGDPSGNDLTVSLAANAAEGDQVSFTITSSDNWTTATPNTDGYLVLQPDFLGGSGTAMDIELDIGSHYSTSTSSWENDALTSTQFARASTTTFQSANGYGAGDLQSITVGTDGAITGQYSNGQVLPLYRVALAKFQNNQALFKVGGNLFRETRLSGDPITGRPGTSGLGSISPNSLEQSNTDIATEFVKMITTQRGFQANSKIITVTDQMLEELIRLKR
jgi:flagellar hook protein FlgE